MTLVLWCVLTLIVAGLSCRLLAGRFAARSQKLRDEINATHTHDNIAVDARSGKVWVRDHHGRQAIFDPEVLAGWDVRYDQTPRASGEAWPYKVFLDLTAMTGERAVWRVRFNRHQELTPGSRNLQECREWSQLLKVLCDPLSGAPAVQTPAAAGLAQTHVPDAGATAATATAMQRAPETR